LTKSRRKPAFLWILHRQKLDTLAARRHFWGATRLRFTAFPPCFALWSALLRGVEMNY
jgi:hypothetical protein